MAVRLATYEAVEAYLRPRFARRSSELFVILCLDAGHRVVRRIELAGTKHKVELHPAALVAQVLMARPKGLVFAHNHPSGLARPSDDDRTATLRFAHIFRMLEITLYDHLIFAGEQCLSMRRLALF